ncbi:MAG: hypothetical protein Q4C96_02185 [Planctomycetia bacterium]|nr:hypothetical protein [Planctomycetia bacterium]
MHNKDSESGVGKMIQVGMVVFILVGVICLAWGARTALSKNGVSLKERTVRSRMTAPPKIQLNFSSPETEIKDMNPYFVGPDGKEIVGVPVVSSVKEVSFSEPAAEKNDMAGGQKPEIGMGVNSNSQKPAQEVVQSVRVGI